MQDLRTNSKFPLYRYYCCSPCLVLSVSRSGSDDEALWHLLGPGSAAQLLDGGGGCFVVASVVTRRMRLVLPAFSVMRIG